MDYAPEGTRIFTVQNKRTTGSLTLLEESIRTGEILEGRAIVCDAAHRLIVELANGLRGVIPREEGACGIDTGETRDVALISRVSKPVCFKVTGMERDGEKILPVLSRKKAQEDCYDHYISTLLPGQVIPAVVTHMEAFGCFVDIGCGISSLIPIDAISVSRISHPRDRFRLGESIFAVVRRVEGKRVYLSHKELLGTWEENAAAFEPGQTVAGQVRSVEEYGIFVELAPNLAGLAEPCAGVRPGQCASVYIKSILPQKMKIKLLLVDAFDASPAPPGDLRYFIGKDRLSEWVYSPASCSRVIKTVFDGT